MITQEEAQEYMRLRRDISILQTQFEVDDIIERLREIEQKIGRKSSAYAYEYIKMVATLSDEEFILWKLGQ